jgi:hypothetical protein
MQERALRFPLFVLAESKFVESDQTIGLSRFKDGWGLAMGIVDDRQCVFVFSSLERAARHVQRGQIEMSAIAVENPHDFISTFGPVVDSGVSDAILDHADESRIGIALQPMLEAMRQQFGK